jgi:hypothetical protein
MTDLHQHCLEVAEKVLPCDGGSADGRLFCYPAKNEHRVSCRAWHRPAVVATLEKELRAERERVLEEAAGICEAKAIYANRSRHGKDQFSQGLLLELENILRDTAKNIRELKGTGK